jgi:hypothetical protein
MASIKNKKSCQQLLNYVGAAWRMHAAGTLALPLLPLLDAVEVRVSAIKVALANDGNASTAAVVRRSCYMQSAAPAAVAHR